MKRTFNHCILALIVVGFGLHRPGIAQSGSLFIDPGAAQRYAQTNRSPYRSDYARCRRYDSTRSSGWSDPCFAPEGTWSGSQTLQAASWTSVPQLPTRKLKIHDLVSIRVDETATSSALGNAQSRKSGLYDARLNDWVDFLSLDTLKPAKQKDGDPRVQGQQNEVYRASSNLRP